MYSTYKCPPIFFLSVFCNALFGSGWVCLLCKLKPYFAIRRNMPFARSADRRGRNPVKSPLFTNNSLALPLVCQLSGYCPVGAAFAQFHRETRLSPATRAPHPAFHSSQHSAATPQPCSRILSPGPTSARARPTCPQMTNSFRFSTTACPASHAPGNKCDLGTRRPALG